MIRTVSDSGLELAAVRGQRVPATLRGRWPGLVAKTRWVEVAPHTLLVFKKSEASGSSGDEPHRVFSLQAEHVTVKPVDVQRAKAMKKLSPNHDTFVVHGVVEDRGLVAGGKAKALRWQTQHEVGRRKLYPHPIYVHGGKTWELAILQAASGGGPVASSRLVGPGSAPHTAPQTTTGLSSQASVAKPSRTKLRLRKGRKSKKPSAARSDKDRDKRSHSTRGALSDGQSAAPEHLEIPFHLTPTSTQSRADGPAAHSARLTSGENGLGTVDAFFVQLPRRVCEKMLFQSAEYLKTYPVDRSDTFNRTVTAVELRSLAQEFVGSVQPDLKFADSSVVFAVLIAAAQRLDLATFMQPVWHRWAATPRLSSDEALPLPVTVVDSVLSHSPTTHLPGVSIEDPNLRAAVWHASSAMLPVQSQPKRFLVEAVFDILHDFYRLGDATLPQLVGAAQVAFSYGQGFVSRNASSVASSPTSARQLHAEWLGVVIANFAHIFVAVQQFPNPQNQPELINHIVPTDANMDDSNGLGRSMTDIPLPKPVVVDATQWTNGGGSFKNDAIGGVDTADIGSLEEKSDEDTSDFVRNIEHSESEHHLSKGETGVASDCGIAKKGETPPQPDQFEHEHQVLDIIMESLERGGEEDVHFMNSQAMDIDMLDSVARQDSAQPQNTETKLAANSNRTEGPDSVHAERPSLGSTVTYWNQGILAEKEQMACIREKEREAESRARSLATRDQSPSFYSVDVSTIDATHSQQAVVTESERSRLASEAARQLLLLRASAHTGQPATKTQQRDVHGSAQFSVRSDVDHAMTAPRETEHGSVSVGVESRWANELGDNSILPKTTPSDVSPVTSAFVSELTSNIGELTAADPPDQSMDSAETVVLTPKYPGTPLMRKCFSDTSLQSTEATNGIGCLFDGGFKTKASPQSPTSDNGGDVEVYSGSDSDSHEPISHPTSKTDDDSMLSWMTSEWSSTAPGHRFEGPFERVDVVDEIADSLLSKHRGPVPGEELAAAQERKSQFVDSLGKPDAKSGAPVEPANSGGYPHESSPVPHAQSHLVDAHRRLLRAQLLRRRRQQQQQQQQQQQRSVDFDEDDSDDSSSIDIAVSERKRTMSDSKYQKSEGRQHNKPIELPAVRVQRRFELDDSANDNSSLGTLGQSPDESGARASLAAEIKRLLMAARSSRPRMDVLGQLQHLWTLDPHQRNLSLSDPTSPEHQVWSEVMRSRTSLRLVEQDLHDLCFQVRSVQHHHPHRTIGADTASVSLSCASTTHIAFVEDAGLCRESAIWNCAAFGWQSRNLFTPASPSCAKSLPVGTWKRVPGVQFRQLPFPAQSPFQHGIDRRCDDGAGTAFTRMLRERIEQL